MIRSIPEIQNTAYFEELLKRAVSQYSSPPNYGVPNPYGPRLHNWKGGPLNEGSLFHGPIYTRPMNSFPWVATPVFGTETETTTSSTKTVFLLVGVLGLTYLAAELLFPRPSRR